MSELQGLWFLPVFWETKKISLVFLTSLKHKIRKKFLWLTNFLTLIIIETKIHASQMFDKVVNPVNYFVYFDQLSSIILNIV